MLLWLLFFYIFRLKHNYSERMHIISSSLQAVLMQAVFPNYLIDFPEGNDLPQAHSMPGLSFCSWVGLINWLSCEFLTLPELVAKGQLCTPELGPSTVLKL